MIAKQDRTYAEALGLIAQEVLPEATISIHVNGQEALAALHDATWDYLLLGLNFRDLDGMDLLLQVSEERLARRVLIMADMQDELVIPSLQTARVDAILDTGSEHLDAIRQALQMVREGKVYISPRLHACLLERGDAWQRPHLTPAELRVLRLIGTGLDNQEAGQALGLSESTVQTHRRNIMHKLKVSTSAKLVSESVRLGYAHISYDAQQASASSPQSPTISRM